MANPNPPAPIKPGESRNPKGSSKKARSNAAIRKQLEALLPLAIDQLQIKITQGDTVAIKLLLERTMPSYRQSDRAIKLPEFEDAPMDQWPKLTMSYLAKGKITPMEAKTLAELYSWVAKSKDESEFAQFLRRIDAGEPAVAVAQDLAQAA